MKIFKSILGALLGIAVILAVIGLILPRSVEVKRSAHINAPPATVFSLVNGFRHFNRYSPWAELDPKTKYVFSGTDEGTGAVMEWHSDDANVGNGRQEIIASIPNEKVAMTLEFDGMGGATSEFWLAPAEGGTDVTWRFELDFGYDLIGRYFGLLMDGMIGPDYEKGLAKLKAVAEEYPPLDLAGFAVEVIQAEAAPLVFTGTRTTMDPEAMQASMASAFGALDTFLQLNELEAAGMPRVITREWNEEAGTWTFDAAYPLTPGSFAERSGPGIRRGDSYAGPALTTVLRGADWEQSEAAYEKLDLYMQLHGYDYNGDVWEAYESHPMTTPPEELVTHIVIPVRKIALQ